MIRSKQQLVHTSLDRLVIQKDTITALEASPHQSYAVYYFPHNKNYTPLSQTRNYATKSWQLLTNEQIKQ